MLVERGQNRLKNTVEVFQNVVVPEAQYEIAKGLEHLRAFGISGAGRMLATVEFDDHARVGAEKIRNVAIDGRLPLELPTIKPTVA
jgi:hypothetical protein